jgi:hypothetical protein
MNLKDIAREGTDQIQEGFQWGEFMHAITNQWVSYGGEERIPHNLRNNQFLKRGSNP